MSPINQIKRKEAHDAIVNNPLESDTSENQENKESKVITSKKERRIEP